MTRFIAQNSEAGGMAGGAGVPFSARPKARLACT